MATANGSAGKRRQEDDPDETTVRTQPVKKVVDRWFSDDQESGTEQSGGGR